MSAINILFNRSLNALVATQFYNSLQPSLKDLGTIESKDPYYKKSGLSERSKWLVSLTENYPEYKPNLGQIATRGIIAYKDDIDNPAKILKFQFNPIEISDNFTPQYEDRIRTGVSESDFLWVSGSVRTMDFTLFLDSTLGSRSEYFSSDKNFTHSDKGVLPQLEFLQALTRPYLKSNSSNIGVFIDKAMFVRGAYVGNTGRFYPPPEIVFVYGNYYLTGVVGSVGTKLTLFNENLIPIRAEVVVSLKIHDGIALNVNERLSFKR